ncbi:hypothetical protein HK098_003140 [Nowakowskiella sp. JEL0407]|nr:hypothetical protein HK098_003140 [Nowakowskiella sp. JEL0407]
MRYLVFTAPELLSNAEIRYSTFFYFGSKVVGWEVYRILHTDSSELIRLELNEARNQQESLKNLAQKYFIEGQSNPDIQLVVRLGPGYVLLKSLRCGLCSTDLARCFLPFPLPQILGHEVVGQYIDKADGDLNSFVVVEINSSHSLRTSNPRNFKVEYSERLSFEALTQQAESLHVPTDPNQQQEFCAYCTGLPTHCPSRITLGINTLPGGFSPYLLAPQNACIVSKGIKNLDALVFAEPLAAALHVIDALGDVPQQSSICVLGPRRLGSLVLCALIAEREKSAGGKIGKQVSITAMTRNPRLKPWLDSLNTDETIVLDVNSGGVERQFDIVVDTTGSQSGFLLALELAKREIHVKSTNGQSVCGLSRLTEMVVDEISLVGAKSEAEILEYVRWFKWMAESSRDNHAVYLSPAVDGSVKKLLKDQGKSVYQNEIVETANELFKSPWEILGSAKFPQFDVAICSSVEEINSVIRPLFQQNPHFSIVRPRGFIILYSSFDTVKRNDLSSKLIENGVRISSSRCGDLHDSVRIMEDNKDLVTKLASMITHRFPLSEMSDAYKMAASKEATKVIVDCSAEE